jgi:HAD superfamily hydrolase (TIGR01549 family)
MVSVPAFPVYIFDVDGTLVDSAEDICGAIRGVLSKTAVGPVSDQFLQTYIGRHLNDLYKHLLPDLDAAQADAMLQDYRSIYAARDHCNTRAYDGVAETLARLPGRKSTATTKGTPTTRIVLERFKLLPYFDHVQGTDGFPAKPEPDVIFKALEGLNAKPEDCLFVGDSPADMEAAKRAGVRSCAVTYGYGQRDGLAEWSPDYWIDHFSQLLSHV